MENNPILDEIDRVRHRYAVRFHYDLKAMYRDRKAREDRGNLWWYTVLRARLT